MTRGKKTEIKEERKIRLAKIDRFVGEKLRDRRKLVSLSQHDLAGKLGLTFQQIQKYEKGTNRIAQSTLYELCEILLVPMGYFYDGIENVIEANDNNVKNNNQILEIDHENLEKLNKNFLKIKSENIRNHIVNMIKTLCDLDKKIANDNDKIKK